MTNANAAGSAIAASGGVGTTRSFAGAEIWTNDQIARQLTHDVLNPNSQGAHAFVLDASRTITVDLGGLTANGAFFARAVLAVWSDATGIRFQQTSGSADITFDDTEDGAYPQT